MVVSGVSGAFVGVSVSHGDGLAVSQVLELRVVGERESVGVMEGRVKFKRCQSYWARSNLAKCKR